MVKDIGYVCDIECNYRGEMYLVFNRTFRFYLIM